MDLSDCASHADVEACAKAYTKASAVAACTAATEGAGALVCGAVASVLVDQVWPYAWGAASAIWGAAGDVVSGFAHGVESAASDAWNSITGGGSPFDKGKLFIQLSQAGNAGLSGAVTRATEGAGLVASKLGLTSSASDAWAKAAGGLAAVDLHLISKEKPASKGILRDIIDPITGAAAPWSAGKELQRALRLSPEWVGGFQVQGKKVAIGFYDLAAVSKYAREHGQKNAWSPGAIYAVTDFGIQDVPEIYGLAITGWQHRGSAIGPALLTATGSMIQRKADLDRAAARPTKTAVVVASVGAAAGVAGLGWWAWRLRKGW